jgi:translocation and assembly module TamB
MGLRKKFGWSLAAAGVFLALVIAGGLLFLRSSAFQRLAMRTIVDDANAATGGRAIVGGFDFELSTLTAHLHDVTLRGGEHAGEPPLLHVDEITVGIKIKSILQRKFTLAQLVVEHPVAHLEVNHDGQNNLPNPPAQTGSNTSVFDLEAQQVLLTNGQLQYNDKKIPVDAELYDLRTKINFEPAGTRYAGSLSYDNGTLKYGGDPVFRHSLNAKFSANRNQFSLHSAELKVGSSLLSAKAELANYSNPTIDGTYDLRIHTQDFSAMAQPVTVAGEVSLSGSMHYKAIAGQAALRNLSLEGEIGAGELAAKFPQVRVNLRSLRGHYSFANGTLLAHDIVFQTLGGDITSDITLAHLDGTPDGKMRSTLRGISLEAAQRGLQRADARGITLSSRLSGTAVASWSGSLNNIIARTDLSLNSGTQQPDGSGTKSQPLNGTIHASYDGKKNTVNFQNTALRIPSASLTLQGEASDHSRLELNAATSDLHGLAELLSALGSKKMSALEIAGSASVKAQVQGSVWNPEVAGEFSASNLQVQGSEWRSVQAGFQASSSQFIIRNAVLANAKQGKASLNAKVGLRNWEISSASPIAGKLSVQKLSIADLQRLADAHYPLAGDLSADISFQGSELDPAGNGSARIDSARAYGEPVQLLTATFHGDKTSLTSTLDVKLAAGVVNGSLAYTPKTKAYVVRLDAPALILQKLQTIQSRNLDAAGTVSLSAKGQGTLDNPQLDASVEIPRLQLRDKSISEIKAQLQVANHFAQISLNSQVAQASLHSQAKIALSGGYYAEASIDTSGVPLYPLLAMYVPNMPQDFQGQTEVHANLKGPLKDPAKIEAHVSIPVLKASYQSLEISAGGPIHADYSDSVITLQPAEIKGTDTSLRVQGSFPVRGQSSPSLAATGSVDVRILKIFDPDLQSSGTVALDIHAAGSAANPAVQGQLKFQEVSVSTPDAPLSVQKLNGTVHIVDNSLQLTGLTAEVGGGQVSAGGSISYRPNLQFNVTLQGKSVRLRYPEGLRSQLDASLVLSGTQSASTLTGLVLIDTLSFTPDFDLAKFSDQFSGGALPSPPGFADNITLAVGLQSKSNLNATSSQVSIAGDANLRVAGTAATPVIVGRADLTSGELFYRSVRYQLQRGIITFDNPVQTEPTLDMSVTTTVEQYNLTIGLRGPLEKLETSYSSNPPLSTADVISLIANGQTTSEASAAGTSTDSIIASQVAGQVTGGLQHLAGISSLQIDPLLGGSQNPSARVAIQQRVTKNFLFTFSTDLSQPGTEIVQGDYQINNRWSVTVTRDEVGGISVDGKYHTTF